MWGDRYCTTCGSVGWPKRVTPGSFLVALVLLLFFLLPGIIYILWQLTSRYDACRSCGGRAVVPLDTPVATRALAVPPRSPERAFLDLEPEEVPAYLKAKVRRIWGG